MAQLEGRVAVVTGGGRGLGRAYCEALAREGAAVVAADIRDTAETVEAIGKTNGRVTGVALDAADMASCETMAKHAVNEFGRIDVLINNAALYGDIQGGRFDKIAQDEWDKTMAVNVRGVWQCTKACVPAMREAGGGSIVNIASLAAVYGMPFGLHYATSKAAVIGMTRALARELGRDWIRGQRHRAERSADRGDRRVLRGQEGQAAPGRRHRPEPAEEPRDRRSGRHRALPRV